MKKSKLFLLALPALLLAGCGPETTSEDEPGGPTGIQWSDISREEMVTAITNHLSAFDLKFEDGRIKSISGDWNKVLEKLTSKITTMESYMKKDQYSLMGGSPNESGSNRSYENQYNLDIGYHYHRETNGDNYYELNEQYTGEKYKKYSFDQSGIIDDNVIVDASTPVAEAYSVTDILDDVSSALDSSLSTLNCVVQNKLKVEDDSYGTIPSMIEDFVTDALYTYKYQKSNHGLYRVTQSYMATNGAAAADEFEIYGVGTAYSITGTINCKYVHVIEFGGSNLLNLETITNGNENEKATLSLSGTGTIMHEGDALTYDAEYLKRNLVVSGFTADVRDFQ